MKCDKVQSLLSAYHDQELDPVLRAGVRAHVQSCGACAASLEQFAELTAAVDDLRQLPAPPDAWPGIASALEKAGPQGVRPARRWFRRTPRWAIAAGLMVVCLAALASWARLHDSHRQMATNFAMFLEELDTDPAAAQQVLVARYDGRPVAPDREAKSGSKAPDSLPNGFARQVTYVLDMPCCTCWQTFYRNDAGQTLTLFEHATRESEWFSGRPAIETQCHGKPTRIVQVSNMLAATWRSDRRYLTLVGAQDIEQISQLVDVLE